MSTTVKSTGTVTSKRGLGGGPGTPGPNGNGAKGNGWHPKKNGDGRRRLSPEVYRVTMWVALSAIVMMFVALSSVYIALPREGWRPIRMPPLFFLSTGIILGSSVTIERARRSLKQGNNQVYGRLLAGTLVLGVGFLISQLLGWRELVAQGVYLSGQPHSSFFYLFTGVHGVHLLGGIMALIYLARRKRQRASEPGVEQAVTDSASLYWHFMGGIWIWLFLLLLILR